MLVYLLDEEVEESEPESENLPAPVEKKYESDKMTNLLK